MPVRDRHSEIDDPGDLPLVTERARVVDVSPLDHNRTDEVARAAARVLDGLDREDLVDPQPDEPPEIDWDGVAGLLDERDDERLRHLLERRERPYPSLVSVTVDTDEPVEFLPGQYLTVRFADTPRPYSVASAPSDDTLEFCIRRVPDGRLTTDLFQYLDAGDEVTVRGPNGEFVARDPAPTDVVMLATGTGVAPLRSIVRHLFASGEDRVDGTTRDVWLFLGCSWADDLPYREEFRALDDRHDNFHFVPTLTREAYLTDWAGETAYVQEVLLKYLDDAVDVPTPDEPPRVDVPARIDPATVEVYACGVSAMVDRLVETAAKVGVPAERVSSEGFG